MGEGGINDSKSFRECMNGEKLGERKGGNAVALAIQHGTKYAFWDSV